MFKNPTDPSEGPLIFGTKPNLQKEASDLYVTLNQVKWCNIDFFQKLTQKKSTM